MDTQIHGTKSKCKTDMPKQHRFAKQNVCTGLNHSYYKITECIRNWNDSTVIRKSPTLH